MDSAWRTVTIVFATVAIVGLILFARGPAENGPHPTHQLAAIERVA